MTQSKIDLEEYSSLIGSKIGISDWITVSQKMIDDFCDVTGDYQFIHNDPTEQRLKHHLEDLLPMAF